MSAAVSAETHEPEQRPFTGELLRPRLVFATGVRLGLSHAFGPLDGVVFLDAGNVFPAIKDFSFSDLREAAGFGVGVHVRSILVRLDLGFPLNRRDGDDPSRLFFSIGQAF